MSPTLVAMPGYSALFALSDGGGHISPPIFFIHRSLALAI